MTKAVPGGKLVARNAARNLLGHVVPMIVAVFCIPPLITVLGKERFGFLTLIWMIVGYLSIFDLGLGKALTKLVSEQLGLGERQKIRAIFWTSMWLMCGLGLAAVAAAELAIPRIADVLFRIPGDIKQEARTALSITVISMPLVILSTGARGVLEAHLRFDLVNWIKVPLGVYTFLAPLLAAHYISNTLTAIAWVLVVGRSIVFCCTLWLCFNVAPELRRMQWVNTGLLRPLFTFGSWMTIVNVLGPLMVYLDRFVIGAVISMAAVAYYVTPYEVVTKLWVFPDALIGVLFPAFSMIMVQSSDRVEKLFRNAINGVFLFMLPLTMVVIVFAHEILALWLNNDFAAHSMMVFQIITIGVFINSFGRVPFSLIQGAGRPDVTSVIFLIELPLYLAALWHLLKVWGIEGAAAAWVSRIVIDNVLLFVASSRVVSSVKTVMWRGIGMTVLPLFFLGGVMRVDVLWGKALVVLMSGLIAVAAIRWLMSHWSAHKLSQTPLGVQ